MGFQGTSISGVLSAKGWDGDDDHKPIYYYLADQIPGMTGITYDYGFRLPIPKF